MRLLRFQQRPIENRIGVMIDANRIAELPGQKNSEPILDFLHDPKHEARAVQTLDNAKKQLVNPEEKSAKGVIGLDSVTVLPPIARPTKIICLGGNFSDHLQMELRVNGQTRQFSSTKNMVFKMRELVEFFSSMTLEPGDIITSGTPSGVAIYRKPDKTPYLLKPGDLVESKIESLGKLQNTIVRETKPTRLPSRHLVLA